MIAHAGIVAGSLTLSNGINSNTNIVTNLEDESSKSN